MKVAIIHDSLTELGGAERVLSTLLKMFPQADVYSSLVRKEVALQITDRTIHRSPLSILPLNHLYSSFLKPFILQHWKNIDLSSYDLIISSSHSFSAKCVVAPTTAPHISYIHTPPRYLYDEPNAMSWIRHLLVASLVEPILNVLRKKDLECAQQPSVLIANSKTVQHRIKKYYDRDSKVIYPPTTMPQKKRKKNSGKKYFLTVSRLVKQKGLELAVNACNQLEEKLIVVGAGPNQAKLQKMAGPTISFVGYVSDAKLAKLYAEAQALLYPSLEEDFGLSPVEAMSHGTPVIGHQSGGVRETVIPSKTGILFENYTTASLIAAITSFKKLTFDSEECRQQAMRFSERKFMKDFALVVKKATSSLDT